MHRTVKTWLGLVIIIFAALAAGVLIWFNQKAPKASNPPIINTPVPDQKGCPADAKLCPDGSAVGRSGPNCEFDPCPKITGIEDKIIINFPSENSVINSPVNITGRARGTWFFEGSFPVEIYDERDKLIGQGIASFAPTWEGQEWMTEDFVNFNGSIKFSYEYSYTGSGYILFKKDNPSDMRELDESFKLQVFFSNINFPQNKNGWKDYRNEDYGFELKYPDKYSYREYKDSDSKGEIFNLILGGNIGDRTKYAEINISVFRLKPDDGNIVEHIMPASKRNFSLGELNGYIYGSGDASRTYVFVKNKIQYEVSFDQRFNEESEKIFVSTFKFIAPE